MSSDPPAAPRLLFVVNVAWFFASHRLALARAAIAAGFCVHLASDFERESELHEIRQCGIEWHHLPVARSGLRPAVEWRTLRELRRIMRRVQPALVHNVTAKAVLYGSWAARAVPARGIVNAMSGFGYAYASDDRRGLLRRAMDLAYARAFAAAHTRLIVQNRADRDEVLRICPSAAERIRLIPGSGVDLERFAYRPEPHGRPTVVLPARLLREKGVYEFAAAAVLLRRAGLAARFVLAGRVDSGNPGSLSEREVQALCAGGELEWLGEVRDMPRLLCDSHIVCLPSYREGMPKVLLEACAAGRAIVTSDTPGCSGAVSDGNGLVVPVRDSGALAEALRRLIEDPALRQRMGLAGRGLAEREFGVQGVIRRHLEIYAELLGAASLPLT